MRTYAILACASALQHAPHHCRPRRRNALPDDDNAKWSSDVDEFAERIESAKAAVVGGLAASVAAAPSAQIMTCTPSMRRLLDGVAVRFPDRATWPERRQRDMTLQRAPDSLVDCAQVLSEDEVELTWSTDDEEANRGFLVERKAVGFSDWDEVASYQSWSPLKSKGTLGGAYSYIDATVSEGEWLYRIVAEQSDNSRAIVCQVGVSVENSGQQLQTKLVVGGFAALVLGALAAGALLDPIKG